MLAKGRFHNPRLVNARVSTSVCYDIDSYSSLDSHLRTGFWLTLGWVIQLNLT